MDAVVAAAAAVAGDDEKRPPMLDEHAMDDLRLQDDIPDEPESETIGEASEQEQEAEAEEDSSSYHRKKTICSASCRWRIPTRTSDWHVDADADVQP